MTTYAELKAQLDSLTVETEKARRAERQAILEAVRTQIKEHGLTAEELYGKQRRPRAKTGPVAPKYRDPKTGATWSGRGREPVWIKGKKRERFAIPS